MPIAHQFTPVLSYGDAVSDDVLELQRIIRSAGYESEIFVVRAHPRVAHLCRPFWQYEGERSPDHILILHFSIGSDINVFTWLSPGKKILIYHNITPHKYFTQVNPVLAAECLLGRYQLSLFKNEVILALADSDYNRQELDHLGIFPNAVYPISIPFTKYQCKPSQDLMELYGDGAVNWLFVGRLIPNKRIDSLIRAFFVFHREFMPHSRLLIVGTYHGFERHYTVLKNIAKKLGIESSVIFTGHLTLEELVACYRVAHVYISLSEHEGFCVPLLEAMSFHIPVIAYAAGAVPETLRGGGILLQSQEPEIVAVAAYTVISDEVMRRRVLNAQEQALGYYRDYPYTTMFQTYLETIRE